MKLLDMNGLAYFWDRLQLALSQKADLINGKVPAAQLPSFAGIIALWSGSASNIPEGWFLCDGNNNTPDLRDRFIVGAGSAYAAGATGGEATHVLSVDEMPGHTHRNKCSNSAYSLDSTFQDPTDRVAGLGRSGASTTNIYKQESLATGYMAPSESIGGNLAHENRPPYFALCYIMKT